MRQNCGDYKMSKDNIITVFCTLFIIGCVILIAFFITNVDWSKHKWQLVGVETLAEANYAYIDGIRTSGEWWTLKFDNGWVIKTGCGSRYILGRKYEIYRIEHSGRYKTKLVE